MDVRRRSLASCTTKAVVTPPSSDAHYVITLNNQWRLSSDIPNPDEDLYDGVYESYSNKGVNSTAAIMYIDLFGYTDFTIYIRSYAESSFDYVMVSQINQSISNETSYSNTTLVKAHTRGAQNSATTIDGYTQVVYSNLDATGSNRITVVYRKDGSSHSSDDRGYLLIKTDNISSGDPDIDITDTNVILYTSTDGNVVTPKSISFGGLSIISNTYNDGVGIIQFNGPVTSIGDSVFSGRTTLTSITIPDSVTSIGRFVFSNCSSLANVIIPNSVTTIGNYAFDFCSSLTSVTIPNSVTSLGSSSFYACSSLTSITIGNRVTSIGDSAFFGCDNLTSITIPNSVTEIGDWTFSSCDNLTSITIGNRVTSIGDNAFKNCISLTSITIPDSVTSIGSYAFEDCESLTSITISNSVTSLGDHTFYDCTSLTSVTIPEGVTTIGSSTFSKCSSLTSITIPEGVTTIGNYAFDFCSSLTSVTIPNSVTSLGGYVFRNCSKLKRVDCKPSTPPAGGNNMFYANYSGRKIYVPIASVDAYKAAQYWSNYADAIEGYDF